MKYQIRYGLGGGFGGSGDWEEIDAETLEDAYQYAYEAAMQYYESYSGSHGLPSIGEIMEDDGVDEEEAFEIYQEERDGWLTYSARQKPEN